MAIFDGPYLPAEQVLLGQSLQPVPVSKFIPSSVLRWEVHPECSIWADYARINVDIQDYLEKHHELRTASGTRCSLCFIGKSKTQVKAAIFIHCEDKCLRKAARKIILKSSEWRDFKQSHPAWHLMAAPKAPTLRAFLSGNDAIPVYGTDETSTSIGATVRFASKEDFGPQDVFSLGRLGPTIFYNDQRYIITVSHQLRSLQHRDGNASNLSEPSNMAIENLADDDGNSSCMSDEDDWDILDEDGDRDTMIGDDLGINSLASDLVNVYSFTEDNVTRELDHLGVYLNTVTDDPSLASLTPEIETGTQSRCAVDGMKVIVGEVVLKSSDVPSKQHDWALIKPDPITYNENEQKSCANAVRGPNSCGGLVRVSQTAAIPRSYKSVWLATSTGQCEEAMLSSSICSYRLPGTHRFLDLLPLHMNRPLLRGESGTAIVDPESGSWYGQVIAAEDDENIAYVLPAEDILDSIAEALGADKESLRFTSEKCERTGNSSTAQSDHVYQYSPLEHGQIRLLDISHSQEGDDATPHVTIRHCQLENAPEYYALSYTWGKDPPRHAVNVNGKQLYITGQLATALSVLRTQDEYNWLWIDGICINQEDVEEKASQVSLMHKIYNTADAVIVWLGMRDGEIDQAIDYVQDAKQSRWHTSFYESKRMSTLRRLFERSLFQRLWVMQEIAYAKDIICFLGERRIPWNILTAVASFDLSTSHERFSITPLHTASRNGHLEVARRLIESSAPRPLLISLAAGVPFLPKTRSLADLLPMCMPLKVSDPRDRVYSLLAIIREDTHIEIDYNKSILDVYAQALDHMIRHGSTLDVLLKPWILKQEQDYEAALPSWIPSFSCTADLEERSWLEPWKHPDSFSKRVRWSHDSVQAYLLHPDDFNAGGLATFQHDMGPAVILLNDIDSSFDTRGFKWQTRKSEYALRCSAVVFGSLKAVYSNDAQSVFLSQLVRSFAQNEDSHEFESLWRTLVADADISGRRPAPVWYGQALADLLCDEDCAQSDLRSLIDLPNEHLAFKTLARRISTVLSGRKLGIAEPGAKKDSHHHVPEGQRLVLVPIGTRQGDLICVFPGCSLPFVLRKTHSSYSNYAYELIGTSYVHGLMDGELLSDSAFFEKVMLV